MKKMRTKGRLRESSSAPTVAKVRGPFVDLREASYSTTSDGGLLVEAILISEGKGNEEDKHYYTREFIETFPNFANGKKCFKDHATEKEEEERPEREIDDVIGYWKDVKASEGEDERAKVVGFHKIPGGPGFERERTLLQEAIDYAKEFPEDCLVGYSICADGETEMFDSETHNGPEELNGQGWTAVKEATGCFSIDLVTFPGAGGEPLSIENIESVRESMRRNKLKKGFGLLLEKVSRLSKSMPKGISRSDLKELTGIAESLSANLEKELEEAVKKNKKKAKEAGAKTGNRSDRPRFSFS